MKTQEELFRHVGEAGLSGGFAIGDRLPRLKGKLKNFKIITLDAASNENSAKFLTRIIKALGEKPIRNLEMRYRRLASLVKTATKGNRLFILIIKNAHLLHPSLLHSLKAFHEIGSIDDPSFYPGIVLLGDVDQILKLIKQNKGVAMRSTIFTKSNFNELDIINEAYGLK